MFSFVFCLFVLSVISHFGFEDWILVLIASVPDFCILFTQKQLAALLFAVNLRASVRNKTIIATKSLA